LIWTNAAAAGFLHKVAPYLRIKSKQARSLTQFVKHCWNSRRRRDQFGRLLPLSMRELEVREAFYRRLKHLNKRGATALARRGVAFSPRGGFRIVSVKYLAGFIDAEGCLMIAKVNPLDCRNPLYRARLCVGNTNRRILEDTQKAYGGILTNHPAQKVAWKDAYQLVWTDRRVESVLNSVRPFLRIKKRHAKILLEFISHKKKTRQGHVGKTFASLPRAVVAYREALYQRIRILNAKGPPHGRGRPDLAQAADP